MAFSIIRDDITVVTADAIVNSANPEPVYARGTDRAVYTAAGAEELLAARKKIGKIKVGDVAVTPAFRLRAQYIFHTVGPLWIDGDHGELDDLASCYRKCLHKAEELKCKSIAFPLISTGVYGFPKDKALSIATREISAFLEEHDMNVILVVFNRDAYELSKDLVKEVQTFIDENYVAKAFEPEYGGFEPSVRERRNGAHLSDLSWRREKRPRPSEDGLYVTANELEVDSLPVESSKETITGSWPFSKKDGLEEIMRSRSETFQQRLFQLIDEKGYKDVDVYRRAGVDRKLFSKIRSNVDYTPKKRTVLAFAIALRLNMDETTDLLSRAGYAFSPSSKSDLIVQFCIHREIYDIFEVDAILFNYHQQSLTF